MKIDEASLKSYEGKTFYYKDNPEKIKRILGFDQESVYIIDLNKNPVAVPRAMALNLIIDDLNNNEIVWTNQTREINQVPELNENQKQVAQKRWESIGIRWNDPEVKTLFFNRNSRNKLINKIALELKVKPRTVRTILTRFWTGGMTRDSLIPEKRGNVVNCGRKAKKGKGLKISREEKENFQKGYQRYHLRDGKSIAKTYTCILRDYYTNCEKNEGNNEYQYKDTKRIPTIDQFRYWIKTHKDEEKEIRSRVGEKEFSNSFAILTSSTESSVNGAGARAELDATHLPVIIVSEDDRSVSLGTPLLEMLVDVYSRQVMGILVTLENESYRTGALTVLNATMDKVEFAREYNIHISESDWPAHHLPNIILSDNGPFISKYNIPLERNYGCRIESATARKGSAKSNVERKNRTFSDYVKETLPGAAREIQKGRGAYDLTREACLTLREVTQIIIKKLVEYNHNLIQGYPLSPEAIRAGILATPLDLWNFSIKQGRDQLIYVTDRNQLKIDLLPRIKGNRVLHRDGIHCNNFIYSSRDPNIQNWMLNHMHESFEIAYNPIDIRFVYLINKNECITLELNDKFADYSKMSKEEIDYYLKLRRKLESGYKEKEELRKMQTMDFEEEVISKSRKQNSNRKKKKGNRREEVNKNRIEELTKQESNANPIQSKEDKSMNDQSETYQQMIDRVIKQKTGK